MITIVDYGLGNLSAFVNAYNRLHVAITIARSAAELAKASKVILPGVGHFDGAMKRLRDSGMLETLEDVVIGQRVPVLGVCVGMQMLARYSEEGESRGLGWVDGYVKRFSAPADGLALPLPHMGWNDVQPVRSHPLFDQVETSSPFYFLHSFFLECAHNDDVLATANYGGQFCSVVNSRNIYGVQFHPEKSHRFGTRLLKNFAEL